MIEIVVVLVVIGTVWLFFYRKKAPLEVVKTEKVEYTYGQLEIGLLNLINAHRETLNLSFLKLNSGVSSKCLKHNIQMLESGEVSHNGFESRSQNIINALGAKAVGENIAYGYVSKETILKAWLGSPRHKENLENPKWTQMGISILGNYVTSIFIC
jgi:uncharacterized protein YkwD